MDPTVLEETTASLEEFLKDIESSTTFLNQELGDDNIKNYPNDEKIKSFSNKDS